MKPEQFIREFGVEKAREVIEGAPDGATHLSNDTHYFVNANFKPLPERIKKQLPDLIAIEDLKRLVHSVDRVNAFGGLKDAKAVVKMGKYYKYLKAHISNYESIYGGGDEN